MKKLLIIFSLIFIMSCEIKYKDRVSTIGIITSMRRNNTICYGKVEFRQLNYNYVTSGIVFKLPCIYSVGDTLKLIPQ